VPNEVTNFLNFASGLATESLILIFIATGVAVLAGVTFISKAWKKYHLDRKRESMENEYKKDWKQKIRPSMADCLFSLYKDLRFTMNKFYPEYREIGFITAYDPASSNSDHESARTILEEEIIQPASIERLFYIPIKPEARHDEEDKDKGKDKGKDEDKDKDEDKGKDKDKGKQTEKEKKQDDAAAKADD
jgi:hypothetical protein